jgi:hypothetical protein
MNVVLLYLFVFEAILHYEEMSDCIVLKIRGCIPSGARDRVDSDLEQKNTALATFPSTVLAILLPELDLA